MASTTTLPTAAAGAGAGADAAEAPKKGKKKLVMIGGVVLLLVGALAAYFLVFSGGGKAEAKPKPDPGAVVPLDPISLNLAHGHFLKIGIALQATKAAKETPDGSKALDIVIDQFSGKDVATLSSPAVRDAAKAKLVKAVEKEYEGEVMDVYFTEFVMQ